MTEASPEAGDSNDGPESTEIEPDVTSGPEAQEGPRRVEEREQGSGDQNGKQAEEKEGKGGKEEDDRALDENCDEDEEEEGEDDGEDDESDDESGDDDDDDEEDEDEEPLLRYARLTQHLSGVYRNGDATSSFLVAGDKMVKPTTPCEERAIADSPLGHRNA